MKKTPFEIVTCIIAIVLSIIAVVLLTIKIVAANRRYQYEDFNGNLGISSKCYRQKSWLYCETEEGKIQEVVKFKTVDDIN